MNNMEPVGYSIDIRFYKGLQFVVIIENENNPGTSVTNSIETILADMFPFGEFRETDGCVYRDSTGTWDGFDGKDFILLGLSSDVDIDRVIGTYILKDRVLRNPETGR